MARFVSAFGSSCGTSKPHLKAKIIIVDIRGGELKMVNPLPVHNGFGMYKGSLVQHRRLSYISQRLMLGCLVVDLSYIESGLSSH